MTARIGVQERILVTVLLLAALAMGLAGGTVLLSQWSRSVDRADAGITAAVAQFRALAQGERAVGAVQVPTDVAALLADAVQRQVPTQDQTSVALVDGRPRFVSAGRRPVALENEPAFLARLAALPADAPTVLRTAATSAGSIRYAAVQVQIAGSPVLGTYVVAVALAPARADVMAAAQTYAIVSVVSLLVVGAAGRVVSGRLLRPLRLLHQAAAQLSDTDLSLRVPVRGHDDITELARTVNAMLDRLQSAFQTQQEFLDDAGHELRTPLTIIGGHLEVLDAGDRGEVGVTRALVLDEVGRMARLVDDLTLLAKARRPDFVRPAPVDLDHLLDSVVSKCSALGPRAWSVQARCGRVLLADAQRLTQALVQLVDNAVRHTEPGDQIAVGARLEDDEVLLWVRDTGSGIAGHDLERIFERFGRGAGTTGRGHDGSGLGLAIVAAIAHAHGGTVRVQSAVGQGATFTLALPAAGLLGASGGQSR